MTLTTRMEALESNDEGNRMRNGIRELIYLKDKGLLREVLDDGFVGLIDVMGNDACVAQAARVSYGAGTKSVSDDRGLIRYLMRHQHTTPFEMAELKFLVRVPMDTWRQWIRTRTASVNEYSTRYSIAIDAKQQTPPDEWRLQATGNRQGSDGSVREWPNLDNDGTCEPHYRETQRKNGLSAGEYLSLREHDLQLFGKMVYDERLAFGVAREQARKDLPLSTYTEAYWKIDLHNLLRFLKLRMDSHAQSEIRQYANAIFGIVKPIFPAVCEAFEDYQLHAMQMSRSEITAINDLLAEHKSWVTICQQCGFGDASKPNREGQEFLAKLERLGMIGRTTLDKVTDELRKSA